MAKKSSSKSKGKSKKKGKEKGSSGGVFFKIILVGIAVIGLIGYGLYQTNEFSGDEYAVERVESAKREGASKAQSSSSNSKSSRTAETFDRTDINAQDGKEESSELNPAIESGNTNSKYYFTSTFDFAWPAYSEKDDIVEHAYFALSYDEKNEQAEWVAYKLTRSNLNNARFKRKDNFKPDPDVKTKSATLADYKGSGYDRGHFAPAADFTWTEQGLDESFFMSNMSPQEPSFNRGIWKKLEEQVRKWAKQEGEIFVVTGPIFKEKKKKIGKNKVAVPSHYYKVLLDMSGNDVKAIAFILPNEKSSQQLSFFAMSVDDLEDVTGFDFFPLIPDDVENQVEGNYNYSDWN